MVEGWRQQPKSRGRRPRSGGGGGTETLVTDPIQAADKAPATDVIDAADVTPQTDALQAAPQTDAIAAAASTPENDSPRIRVLLLGSGEANGDVVIALQRLGAEVIVAVRRGVPAPIADRCVTLNIADKAQLAAAIARLQPGIVVVATSDPVATDALTAAAEAGPIVVVPGALGARLAADREAVRRLAADELGLPTAPFWFAGSVEELRDVTERAGFPMLVKPVTAARGAGESVLLRADDVDAAWRRAISATGGDRVLAETVVEVDHEVTLLTVRSVGADGPSVDFCAPIGHRRVADGDSPPVLECWQPQSMSRIALDAAKSIAGRVVSALDGRGVFAVELMIHGDEVYFADVSLQPQDTALVTVRSQRLSAAELQARAILGLPVDTIMISPGAAQVIYTDDAAVEATGPESAAALGEALAVPETDAVIFEHHHGDRRRRLGAVVATGSDVAAAREHAEQASAALLKRWP